jgi:cell division protein ZapA (FtsZ GTPase activity inhibitor)
MEKDNLISRIIQIAGEKYPVRLTEKESQIADQVEREINQKMKDFQLKFMVKSKQDVLAMLLLTYAFESKMVKKDPTVDLANSKIERLLQTFTSIEEE